MNTKQLRQKILDLAIRGKLVLQDPNDEPASVLLERVRIEKERLIKEGKIKRDKKDSAIVVGADKLHYEQLPDGSRKCIEDEIPFEVPDSWSWVRLGSIALYKKGPFGSSITKSMFVPDSDSAIKVYEQKNAIYKNESLGSYFISSEKFEELKGFEVFPHDIIVSCAGTIGESFVMPSDIRRGIINQALMRIILYVPEITEFYLMYFDFVLKGDAKEQGKGTAMKNIPPFDVLKQYLMPLPPQNEQVRIIEYIKQIQTFISTIETNKNEIRDIVTATKSKILSLAISGKLVPQDPADEPASVLLARIRAEKESLTKTGKIKRDKSDAAIVRGDDNSYYEKIGGKAVCINEQIPFEVPESWVWARLGDVAKIIMGQSPSGDSVSDNPSGTEFHQGKIFFADRYLKHSRQFTTERNKIVDNKSVLLCVRAPVGIVNIAEREIAIGRGLCAVTPLAEMTEDFIFHWLTAFQSDFIRQATGTTFIAITTDVVKNQLIPIPPIDEQHRIIEIIESAFAYMNSITESLN